MLLYWSCGWRLRWGLRGRLIQRCCFYYIAGSSGELAAGGGADCGEAAAPSAAAMAGRGVAGCPG
jgi:hypothetical protein